MNSELRMIHRLEDRPGDLADGNGRITNLIAPGPHSHLLSFQNHKSISLVFNFIRKMCTVHCGKKGQPLKMLQGSKVLFYGIAAQIVPDP